MDKDKFFDNLDPKQKTAYLECFWSITDDLCKQTLKGIGGDGKVKSYMVLGDLFVLLTFSFTSELTSISLNLDTIQRFETSGELLYSMFLEDFNRASKN